MPSTESNARRGSSVYGAARRTVSYQSSAASSSIATAATVCWASTSSAFFTSAVCSMRPSYMPSAATAASMISVRVRGKMDPVERPPTWWFARPMRCRALATDGGAATCSTRSMDPMSMPSSSDEVATTHGSSPAFSSRSTCRRFSFDTDPWCAFAMMAGAPVDISAVEPRSERMGAAGASASTPRAMPMRLAYRSFRRAVSFSHSPREFTNTMVVRCASTSSRMEASM